ncbi:hypothetical protein [Nonlabens marinus]|uniref:Uncharacterized protein n=1 Tax=Nonlabens marinus S1-08 TaxID=1454201 RepID=W8VVR5_9FLAO|nr:hypothetical protein [Nonlabens marinus]BAO55673.1 hypothetical protein NMS_1664 [Nonlabens marinus S1-08]
MTIAAIFAACISSFREENTVSDDVENVVDDAQNTVNKIYYFQNKNPS